MKNIIGFLLGFLPVGALAHNRYVVPDAAILPVYDVTDSVAALVDPFNIVLICVTLGAVFVLYLTLQKVSLIRREFDRIHLRLVAYEQLVPWIFGKWVSIGQRASHHKSV